MAKTRLDPKVFKVPIDKIRAGYYSDKYFIRVSEILQKERHNPRVLYQFFVRKPAVIVGIDEALAILQYCVGYYSDEEKEILKPWRYDEDDRPALKLSGVVKWFKINLIENE